MGNNENPKRWQERSHLSVKGPGAAQNQGRLTDIFEPVVVGIPPSNPFRNLVQLPDGTLRCYGYRGSHPDTKPVYLESSDRGFTWIEKEGEYLGSKIKEESIATACSPYSGEYYHLEVNQGVLQLWRSISGIDGPYEIKALEYRNVSGQIRLPLFLQHRRRVLVATNLRLPHGEGLRNYPAVLLSDDDGYTWKLKTLDTVGPHPVAWPHKGLRWQQYAVEPTVAELSDGRLWMLMRTSADFLYEAYSEDGGDTWSVPQPSRFHATITMPTLLRLGDGRILLVWLNTTPLPERDHSTLQVYPTISTTPWWRPEIKWVEGVQAGVNEDVFTNRDAIHASISEDDGVTWKGFRELYLNPLRNEGDFALSHGGPRVSLDKGVNQAQAMEVSEGKVLVALGQHPACRRMLLFDVQWLYETKRKDDFSRGLEAWSVHQYIDEIKGHLAYDRKMGACLTDHPQIRGRHVLHIRRASEPELVSDIQGAVWNFPASHRGTLATHIMPLTGCKGGWIGLMDRWFNPSDCFAQASAMYSFRWDTMVRKGWPILREGEWNEIQMMWTDLRQGDCLLMINGQEAGVLPLNRASANGISYVIFQSSLDAYDEAGFLVEQVGAECDMKQR